MLVLVLLSPASGQRTLSGETQIRLALDRLNTLGAVLMIAAHPDDENTALLAYFARGRHLRTGYLSLTRGEGGQNLIGPEQGDLLGLIRTQELLAARKIDGGEQFFTRAIDFGFSKTMDETLAKWGRERVLGDVVWTIRRFRPDIIVLRFSGTASDGHGHHQSSAVLGREAFEAAADPAKFPEQLKLGVSVWKTRRLFFNTFSFTAEQQREAEKTSGRLELDLGEYSPVLGYSFGEIAGVSRSQHRSQAFGAAERKGSIKNYLLQISGDQAESDPLNGIDVTWTRVAGGEGIGKILADARQAFDPKAPEKIIPLLTRARAMLANSSDPWAVLKRGEIEETIALCAGLWLDAVADRHTLIPGGPVRLTVTALNRSPARVALTSARIEGAQSAPTMNIAAALLTYNRPSTYSVNWTLPESQPYSQPYWLEAAKERNLYAVRDPKQIGEPENPPVLRARFGMKVEGEEIEYVRPIIYRWVDPALGELTRPLTVAPPVSVEISERSLVFPGSRPKHVEVSVQAAVKSAGLVQLDAPAGWRVNQPSRAYDLSAGEQRVVSFEVTPPENDSHGILRASVTAGSREVAVSKVTLDYPHIPRQTLFPAATAELVHAEVRTLARNVAYIMGAGDEVPDALRQLGCEVTLLSAGDLSRGDLARFDAIVAGVRAFDTRPEVRANRNRLYDYVRGGGVFIVQYNRPDSGLLEDFGPYPIRISRSERVSVEDAPVNLPNPDHPLLQSPNRITAKDFEGWIQERGLYFATEWDPKYETVFESNDLGEPPRKGGMLYVRLGKGVYIYSAYSWFRQLPAGVPGAYRIFANMLSAAKAAAGP